MNNPLIFTLVQASLSAGLSVFLGIIFGMVIIRSPYSEWCARLGFFPFFFPPLLVTIFVIAFFGNSFLDGNIFGIQGIIIAHLFLNVPLVMHIYLDARKAISHEAYRLAYITGAFWRGIEWPVIRQVFPTGFALTFLYCSLSFTIVLILGGVKAMTLEYAIYQALIFEYDIMGATVFAFMQAGIGLVLFFTLQRNPIAQLPAGGRSVNFQFNQSGLSRLLFASLAFFLVILVNLPLIVIVGHFNQIFPKISSLLTNNNFLLAIWHSLIMALSATGISLFLSVLILWKKWENLIWLLVSISPLVLSMAYILIVRNFLNPFDYGVIFVIFVQAIAITPFISRMLALRLHAMSNEERRLIALTLMTDLDKTKYFYLPIFAPVAKRACAVGFCLAISDLSVMPIFAPTGYDTLPVYIWRAMGQYRLMDSYAGLTILLIIITIILTFGSYGQKYE